MDERVARLKSPEDCEKFAKNATRLGRRDLADQARRRAIELRAAAYGGASEVETECVRAVFAYEETLTKKNGRRTRANRTWQMIDRHGILAAVERAVNRSTETAGYRALEEMGLQDLTFEAIILRHPELFSEDAVRRARERIEEWDSKQG